MTRALILVAVIALVAASAPSSRSPQPISFAFERASVSAGERVTVRAEGFRSRAAVRVYLVRAELKPRIRSALDRRLSFAGTLRPRGGSAATTLVVPPLESGVYAAWCAGCGTQRSRFLRVNTPPATAESCPVTLASGGRYGTNLLWTTLRHDGVITRQPEPDGSIFWKFGWVPAVGINGVLSVEGKRLDASSRPMRVLGVNWGYSSTGRGSWATAVTFPASGCWKLTARMQVLGRSFAVDVSYILEVARP